MRPAGNIHDNEGSAESIDMARDGARRTQLTENSRHAERNPTHLMGTHQRRHVADQLILGNGKNRDKVYLASRIDSFRNGWPVHLTRATIKEFAEAGLFYLGVSDRTQCFYCNGRINQWEYNDDPWIEHAKWFPTCEFVLAKKGFDFVLTVVKAYAKQNTSHAQNSRGLVASPNFSTSPNAPTSQAATPRGNQFRGQVSSIREINHTPMRMQRNFVSVPIRPAKRGTTESDALPIVHCHASDAETEPAPSYVFMSDPRSGRDRLASFTYYPEPFLQSMWLAAQQGFFFTGVRDTAQCYSLPHLQESQQENHKLAPHYPNGDEVMMIADKLYNEEHCSVAPGRLRIISPPRRL